MKSVLDSVMEAYAEKLNVQPPVIVVDDVHLPPAPSHHNVHGPHWYVVSFDILC